MYLDFRAMAPDRTEVTLRNFGYGQGEDWPKTKAYFAQGMVGVMDGLQKRFDEVRI